MDVETPLCASWLSIVITQWFWRNCIWVSFSAFSLISVSAEIEKEVKIMVVWYRHYRTISENKLLNFMETSRLNYLQYYNLWLITSPRDKIDVKYYFEIWKLYNVWFKKSQQNGTRTCTYYPRRKAWQNAKFAKVNDFFGLSNLDQVTARIAFFSKPISNLVYSIDIEFFGSIGCLKQSTQCSLMYCVL